MPTFSVPIGTPAPRRKQWVTQMTKTSFRGGDLTISLLRTLSPVMEVRSRLVSSEILGNDRRPLIEHGSVGQPNAAWEIAKYMRAH